VVPFQPRIGAFTAMCVGLNAALRILEQWGLLRVGGSAHYGDENG